MCGTIHTHNSYFLQGSANVILCANARALTTGKEALITGKEALTTGKEALTTGKEGSFAC